MSEPVLRAIGVRRVYGDGTAAVTALDGVDLDLHPGEFVVLRGRSGAGKSTLLAILSGLDAPTAGRVELNGRPVADADAVRRGRVASVFQSFALIPVLSASENVEVPLRVRRVRPDERRRRVAEALAAVGLAGHALQRPAELSGGQQQRVGIARAIVGRPSVLLADEPTGQLDSETGRSVVDLLVRLVHERSMSALVATHDPSVAERADRVVEIRDGRLVHHR
ncbi:putative ABC transport system ATP-binding protein [Diaminobutyricimonas aerilata]|uniref:Putative ABC transport system ATP-binding protein n=1 Tax=Diaminobutyricimonas aerilata TaxID=1162967 RepID=A0A2M9CJ58_9MICO|nr:ABC transporter ATP-binding protein [Diaminobutyricimonas aerilata]PJJ71895.1 putative ABC transport system ATP-binding protein [Diaminobutyricimonas aerilata]